jgi:RNA methyltransferase, TrmH family
MADRPQKLIGRSLRFTRRNRFCYASSMAQAASSASERRLAALEARVDPRQHIVASRDNRWLKAFRAALQGKGPSSGEPIGVEGPRLVEDALRSGLVAEALLVSESGEREAQHILGALTEREAGLTVDRILRTTDKLFATATGTETPQGVAALFRQREWGVEDVLRGPGPVRTNAPLIVVLAAVQDPGNVGTVVRSAEAFGATGVVATRGSADPWSPKALRASAGSALRLPVLRAMAIPILIAQLKVAGLELLAATSTQPSATDALGLSAQADLSAPVALFIGNEGGGLPAEVTRSLERMISIPTTGTVESLNAAIAASILLYEAARQRRLGSR